VSPVKYELGFFIPEDDILLSRRRENLRSHIDSERQSYRPWTLIGLLVVDAVTVSRQYAER
jgi:hypothetical protein